jgi:SAM-dependent methyltransferase
MTRDDPATEASRLQELANYSGDPWTPRNKYFQAAEAHIEEIWRTLIFPFLSDCDFTAVIDLGAGHGRNSTMLAPRSKRLLVLDIQEGNVEVCRRRFAGQPHVTCAANNGYDLRPAEDGAFSLVYSFDSMVHFEKEVVRSYLRDTARVLRPGGRGFFHHSNYTGGTDWRTNPHARNFMSRELFESHARDAGLQIVRQMVFEWGHIPELDCLSVVEKP